MRDPIVGIDLGTSNSVVAYADGTGNVRVLSDEGGYKIHPSVVSFHPSGGVVVGASAKQRKVIDPRNTIFSVKRLIGRSYDSPEVQIAKQRMPYQIKDGPNHLPIVVTRGGEFAVPEISAIVLDHMRTIATAQLQNEVSRAVVTVPASFNDAQRSATATAGAISGLTIVRVLNEPTAAALAYGHTRDMRETIAVYDFGGGTFDITILRLADNVYEVLGTSGDTFLGGDDLDERLVDRMVEKFLADNRVDLRTNEVSMMRLRAVAEQTKIELSRRSRAVVRVDEIAYGPNGRPLDLQIEVSRDEFVKQVADIIDRTFPVCQEALTIAGLGIGQIDDVILVGGTTKIPYVRDQVTRFFAKAPRTDVNPEEAVAVGAALQATALERILTPSKRASEAATASDFAGEETTRGEPLGDTSKTMPGAQLPVPQLADDTNELTLTPPNDELTRPGGEPAPRKRPTQGYAQKEVRDERAPARGAAIDRYEPTTPTPPPRPKLPESTVPIGRVTKTMPAPPAALMRTQLGVPSAPEPPPRPPLPPAPTPQPPPAPRTAPRPSAERPPGAPPRPTQIAPPPAKPDARTLVLDPNPASTDRGIGPPPSDTDTGLSLEMTAPRMPAPSAPAFVPATTAPGIGAPPVAPYPVAANLALPEMHARPAPTILDVTPRGLGIRTVAGFCEELIRRNSRVPTEIRKLFTTSRDRQDTVRIVVVQGESKRVDNNVVIGDLTLSDIPPRARGETSIEVTFMLDASGILQVSARDAQTGREQHASLDIIGTVPQDDVAASRERFAALRR